MTERNLDSWRQEIDDIDHQIIKLLARRFALVRKIGEYKRKHNLPALDSKRRDAVLTRWKERAKALKLPERVAVIVYTAIHDEAVSLEEQAS